MYVYHCAQLSCTTQHRTVLIISPSSPPLVIVQMLSTGGEGAHDEQLFCTSSGNSKLFPCVSSRCRSKRGKLFATSKKKTKELRIDEVCCSEVIPFPAL